jgi:hypothetical protein
LSSFVFKCLVIILAALLPASQSAAVIYQDSTYSLEEWDNLAMGMAGQYLATTSLDDIRDSLTIGVVGVVDTHTLSFTQTDSLIYPGGRFLITFPSGFDTEGITNGIYSDSDPANSDFLIDSIRLSGNTYSIYLDTLGTTPAPGSAINIILEDIINSTVSGSYQIVLAILDSNGVVLSGPDFSESFILEPGTLDSIQVLPAGVREVRAGKSLQYSCKCFDEYSNPRECGELQWSVIGAHIGGEIDGQGVFFARYVGPSQIVCEVDTFADTSGVVFVKAGDFNRLSITGLPDTVIAGTPFPDSIYVIAQDVYGNTVGSYKGPVWFESSDSQADITVDSANPYLLDEVLDGGRKTFAGQGFVLKTAGLQLIYVTDGDSSSIPGHITVLPDSPASFNVALPNTTWAGEEFSLEVDGLADAFGNSLSGAIDVALVSDGTAPDGTAPVINSVFAVEGGGEAMQKLVRAGTISFILTIDTVSVLSNPIIVLNAAADRFEFELSSPQIVGVAFSAPARLTALDAYGNLAGDFNASTDTVEISPVGEGSVINGIIGDSLAFIKGECDLTRFDVAYNGAARFLKFSAESRAGISGLSETVEINSYSIERLDLSTESLYRGDKFYASITISNYGSLPLSVDGITLTSTQGEMIIDSIQPDIPIQIPGNNSMTYELHSFIPFTFASGMISFKAGFSGFYNLQPVSDESGYLDSMKILSQQEATYVEGSLSPSVVSKGSLYAFRLALKNAGVNVISLSQESFLYFANDADTFRAYLDVPIFLPTSDEQVTLFFEEKVIPEDLTSGTYSVNLLLSGLQGSSSYSEELILSDSVTLQIAPQISFILGSLEPDSVYRGSEIEPVVTVSNNGEAALLADPDLCRLELSAGGQRIIFRMDSNSVNMPSGMNQIEFEPGRIPSDFPVGANIISLYIEGSANGHTLRFNFELGQGLLTILEQGKVQIMRTSIQSINSPMVNIGQEFQISVLVNNQGQEILDSVWIKLVSEGSAISESPLMITGLMPDGSDSVLFDITASDIANPAEMFRADIISAVGRETGIPGIILNPEDNTAVATIQIPASIRASLGIISPPEALDGVLNISQDFVIEAEFENTGQSQVDIGLAELLLPAGFSSPDEMIVAFQIGDPISWTIKASSSPAEAEEIILEIISAPTDQNTLQPAFLENSVDTLTVTVEERLPRVFIQSVFEAYDLIYPGQTLPVLDLEFVTDALISGRRGLLSGIEFVFADREGRAFDLSDLLLSAAIIYEDLEFSGAISSNQLHFDFGENVVFDDQAAARISLELIISDNATQENFIIMTDSSHVYAYDYSFGTVGGRLSVFAGSGQQFGIEKSYGALPADFASSFCNYPNPFNPNQEETAIVYYLPVDSEVQFDIYTLMGDPVFSTRIPSGVSGGLGGSINKFFWNGRNGNSMIVREGVYIAVISYSGGEARTKIAVVK